MPKVNTLFGVEEIPDTKMCYKCRETKHFDDFAIRGHRKDGTRETKNVCKKCSQEQSKILTKHKKYISKPDTDYRCTICEFSEEEIKGRGAYQGFSQATSKSVWVLDHCHDTGDVREYICDYCNIIIGRSLDNAKVLIRGALYLLKHSKHSEKDIRELFENTLNEWFDKKSEKKT